MSTEGQVEPTTRRATSLRMTGIHKAYPGVVALKDVNIDVAAGEIHAIVGENGAGKSTLIGVAAGSIQPDSGVVEIAGERQSASDPRAAQEAGLAVVYQHPALLKDLTVAENMALAMPRGQRPAIRKANSWAGAILADQDVNIDPRRRVEELKVAERHHVEIVKALTLRPKILILDEPTEPLDAGEVERLFSRVHEVARTGTAVIYISHRLPEVRQIADRVTVLRDGQSCGTFAIDDVTEAELVDLIVGRELTEVAASTSSHGDERVVMTVKGFGRAGEFHDVDLVLNHGEVVGLGGIAGNGQSEFLRALAGHGHAEGSVTVGGNRVKIDSPQQAARSGVVYVPGDRQRDGVFGDLSVRENMTVAALRLFSRGGVIKRGQERSSVHERMSEFAVRAPDSEENVAHLSGGNQQKVLLARALMTQPRVLLVEEPTAGVDVGARQEIYRMLREAADDGVAVIEYSSDVKELEELCDKVLVFSRGRVINQLTGGDVNEDSITRAALTSTHLRTSEVRSVQGRLRRFLVGDFAPSAVLLFMIIALAAYTNSVNDRFMSQFNLTSLLFGVATVVFLALAQQMVMITGGIDLSLGPMAGLLVILASFMLGEGSTVGTLVLAIAVMLVVGMFVGALNGSFVRYLHMSSVVATLVTYTALQGISLLLRPRPEGRIDSTIVDMVSSRLGTTVPGMFVFALVVVIGLELMLRWSSVGVSLRAIGSEEATAARLGVRTQRLRFCTFVGAGFLTGLGAIVLMAQIGVGDADVGGPFTLASITAVVLGGGSIFGARGSFVGALLGALLLQEFLKATVFLEAGPAWEYWLVGLLALISAGLYSKLRTWLTAR